MGYGEYLKQLRENKQWSVCEAARRARVSDAYLSQLERDIRENGSRKLLAKLARIYDTTVDDIRSGGQVKALSCVLIPVYGSVPCGTLEIVEQEGIESILIPIGLIEHIPTEDVFAVKASGNSLVGDGIQDGDYLIVQKQASFIDGAIYIVRLENETGARHVYQDSDSVRLVSSGGAYQEMKVTDVELLGRVILFGKWQRV